MQEEVRRRGICRRRGAMNESRNRKSRVKASEGYQVKSRHLVAPGGGERTARPDLDGAGMVVGSPRALGGQGAHRGGCGRSLAKGEHWCQQHKPPGDAPASQTAPLEAAFTPSPGSLGPVVWFFQPSMPWGSWDAFHGWGILWF